jgi:hypothetical protein
MRVCLRARLHYRLAARQLGLPFPAGRERTRLSAELDSILVAALALL